MLAGVCSSFALISGLLATAGSPVETSSSTVLLGGSLLAAALAGWSLIRGRLHDGECTVALLVILTVATLQGLSYTSPSLRWATVFGLAGVPLITLMITRVRWAVLVTVACLACQTAVVISVTEALLDRVVCLTILAGDMPLFVGYIALLLRRADQQRRRAEHAAEHDQLTGLLNRRGLWRSVPALVDAAGAHEQCVGVVAIDLDHFKKVNDIFGHDAGDALLAAVGAHLSEVVRGVDLPVRMGGEELTVVGCFADRAAALRSAERLRLSIAAVRVAGAPQVTASIGVATCSGDDLSGEPRDVVTRLLVLADRAMYQAKASGRDRVEAFDEGVPGPPSPQEPSAAETPVAAQQTPSV